MKGLLYFLIIVLSLCATSICVAQENPKYHGIVFFITGAPFPSDHPMIKPALDNIKQFMQAKHPEAFFQIIHNSKWKKIMQEIRDLRKENGEDQQVIIMGHSYGAQAAVNIARKFVKENVKINVIMTFDTIRKFFDKDPELISDNVDVNFNFFETKDLLLRGHRHNHRFDGSTRGISNTKVPGPFKHWPHHEMVMKLTDAGVIYGILESALNTF